MEFIGLEYQFFYYLPALPIYTGVEEVSQKNIVLNRVKCFFQVKAAEDWVFAFSNILQGGFLGGGNGIST